MSDFFHTKAKGSLSWKWAIAIGCVVLVAVIIIAVLFSQKNADTKKGESLLATLSYSNELYSLNRAGTENEFTQEQVQPLLDKLALTSDSRVAGEQLSYQDGGYNLTMTMYPKKDNRSDYITLDFITAVDKNGKEIFCVSLLNTNSYHVYEISESDWFEISDIFNACFDANNDAQTTAPETETAPELKSYDSAEKLCSDYLTAYFKAVYDGEEFIPSLYIDDEDMSTYAQLVNDYDKSVYDSDGLIQAAMKAEKMETSEENELIYVIVPYVVEYVPQGGTAQDPSGFGRKAYFEIESTGDGLKIHRALLFTPADFFATGLDEKNSSSAKIPMEYDIEHANSVLLSQKMTDEYQMHSVILPANELGKTEYNESCFDIAPFSAEFILPSGWTISSPAGKEPTLSGMLLSPVNIYDGARNLVGTIEYNTYEHIDGIPDEDYYKVVYSQIRGGSIVSLGEILPVSSSPDGENAVSVRMVNQMDGTSAAGSTIKEYPVALSYSKSLEVYVCIHFDVDVVTDKQLTDIAKSIILFAEGSVDNTSLSATIKAYEAETP